MSDEATGSDGICDLTAQITGVDADRCNPGAVNATLYLDGREIGSVELVPSNDDGLLITWGPSIDFWADDAIQRYLDDADDPYAATQNIVTTVRASLQEHEGT